LKLLVDENLPPRLVYDLADLFPNSTHVSFSGLSASSDALIWEYAKRHGFAFLTKDKDFANLSIVLGPPPKVILIQTGNCSVADLIRIIRGSAIRFSEFDQDDKRSLLILK
jgi:predicted nuclease of predicted toxin-antitoxin system